MCDELVGGVHENNVVYSHSVVDDDPGDGLDVDAVVVGGLNADDDAVVAIVDVVGSVVDMVHCFDAVDGRVFEQNDDDDVVATDATLMMLMM